MNNAATQTDLSPTALDALHKIITQRGATIHSSTRTALHTRGLVTLPFFNQPNYCRATDAGRTTWRAMRANHNR